MSTKIRCIDELRKHARLLKMEIQALYLAARHPLTPWYAKLLVMAVVAYALSPIDLIPDFIPVLGYLDDLILLPLGIAWAIRLIPLTVMTECRERAQGSPDLQPASGVAAAVIVLIWAGLTVLLAVAGWQVWKELPSR